MLVVTTKIQVNNKNKVQAPKSVRDILPKMLGVNTKKVYKYITDKKITILNLLCYQFL